MKIGPWFAPVVAIASTRIDCTVCMCVTWERVIHVHYGRLAYKAYPIERRITRVRSTRWAYILATSHHPGESSVDVYFSYTLQSESYSKRSYSGYAAAFYNETCYTRWREWILVHRVSLRLSLMIRQRAGARLADSLSSYVMSYVQVISLKPFKLIMFIEF